MSIRAIYERRKEWFLNEKGRQQKKDEENDGYNTEEEIFEGISDKTDEIPDTQYECVSWLKSLGYKVRYVDWNPLAKKIIKTLKE